jgi:hypothetical protein
MCLSASGTLVATMLGLAPPRNNEEFFDFLVEKIIHWKATDIYIYK